MERLEKLATETKFVVSSRRITLFVTGAATLLIICFISLFTAVVVVKLHSCSGSLDPQSPQAVKAAKAKVCLEPGCLEAAKDAVECMFRYVSVRFFCFNSNSPIGSMKNGLQLNFDPLNALMTYTYTCMS